MKKFIHLINNYLSNFWFILFLLIFGSFIVIFFDPIRATSFSFGINGEFSLISLVLWRFLVLFLLPLAAISILLATIIWLKDETGNSYRGFSALVIILLSLGLLFIFIPKLSVLDLEIRNSTMIFRNFIDSSSSFKNLSLTEELSFKFRSIDINSVIQKQNSKIWWNNNEGYSIIASTSESIFVAKDFSGPLLDSNMIPGEMFKRELDVTKSVFTERGFILNKNNSSTSTDDQKFFDYVQAYEKDNYLCAITVNAEVSSYPSSGTGEQAKMGYLLYVGCTDKLALAEVEQIPFLDALNFKNKEQVAELINSEDNYFHVEIHGRRAGQAVILKKENDKYRVLLISQEAPFCSLIDKEKIPSSVLTSIGGGDCYADNSTYIKRAK